MSFPRHVCLGRAAALLAGATYLRPPHFYGKLALFSNHVIKSAFLLPTYTPTQSLGPRTPCQFPCYECLLLCTETSVGKSISESPLHPLVPSLKREHHISSLARAAIGEPQKQNRDTSCRLRSPRLSRGCQRRRHWHGGIHIVRRGNKLLIPGPRLVCELIYGYSVML